MNGQTLEQLAEKKPRQVTLESGEILHIKGKMNFSVDEYNMETSKRIRKSWDNLTSEQKELVGDMASKLRKTYRGFDGFTLGVGLGSMDGLPVFRFPEPEVKEGYDEQMLSSGLASILTSADLFAGYTHGNLDKEEEKGRFERFKDYMRRKVSRKPQKKKEAPFRDPMVVVSMSDGSELYIPYTPKEEAETADEQVTFGGEIFPFLHTMRSAGTVAYKSKKPDAEVKVDPNTMEVLESCGDFGEIELTDFASPIMMLGGSSDRYCDMSNKQLNRVIFFDGKNAYEIRPEYSELDSDPTNPFNTPVSYHLRVWKNIPKGRQMRAMRRKYLPKINDMMNEKLEQTQSLVLI